MATARRPDHGAVNPRQRLSKRQAATVDRLLEAGLAELRENGYEQLTLRSVASRAGVTHTTGYSYYSSKGHLIAAILWHHLEAVPDPEPHPDDPLGARLTAALHGPGLLLADEPALADAALTALMLQDPDIRHLRNLVGLDLARRVQTAFDGAADPAVSEVVLLAFSGAMLQAGMGYFDFAGVVERIAALGDLLDRLPDEHLGR